MSRRYLLAGLGVLALAVALAIPELSQPNMGPGMTGPRYGRDSPAEELMSLDTAADQVRETLRGYDDLMVKEVMEFSNHFYVLVEEKGTGIGAFEVIVERNGFTHLEPGPNMIWNTKYGHMAGYGGVMGPGMMGYAPGPSPGEWGRSWQPNAPGEPLSLERTRQIAVQYLASIIPGTTPDEGTPFYGYVTFDAEREGKPMGMLSVNAYTGQVWYHTWHGTFVQEKEF